MTRGAVVHSHAGALRARLSLVTAVRAQHASGDSSGRPTTRRTASVATRPRLPVPHSVATSPVGAGQKKDQTGVEPRRQRGLVAACNATTASNGSNETRCLLRRIKICFLIRSFSVCMLQFRQSHGNNIFKK